MLPTFGRKSSSNIASVLAPARRVTRAACRKLAMCSRQGCDTTLSSTAAQVSRQQPQLAGMSDAPELITPQAVPTLPPPPQQHPHRQPRRHDDPADGSSRRMPLQQRSGPPLESASQRKEELPHSLSQADAEYHAERRDARQAPSTARDMHSENRHDLARDAQQRQESRERQEEAGHRRDPAMHQQHQQQQQPEQQQRQQAQQEPPRRRVREDENTVVVRNTRYTKLECVGRGGSSKVFKVRLYVAIVRKAFALTMYRDAQKLCAAQLWHVVASVC